MKQLIAVYKKNHKKAKWQLNNVLPSVPEAEKYTQLLKQKYLKMGFDDVQTAMQLYTNINIDEIPEVLAEIKSEKIIFN